MRIERVSEIGLLVTDLEAATRLYRDILGGEMSEVVSPAGDGRWRICRFRNIDLRLMESATANGAGDGAARGSDRIQYVGLRVASVTDVRNSLTERGIAVADEKPRGAQDLPAAFVDPAAFHGVRFKLVAGKYDLVFSASSARNFETPVDRLLHVGINVRDLDTAMRRFADIFELPYTVSYYRPVYGLRFAFLRAGNVDLELLAPSTPEGLIARSIDKVGEGIAHLCWSTPNITATLDWLREHRCRLIDEQPMTIQNLRAAFVHPEAFNGVLHELVEGEHRFFESDTPQIL
ncbi:MAG: hypothetical protein EPO21_02405 [Chloroflexota bacterium]|nr:MAG: hypothetical protein EPO21_02405 [Chloroflexota bacterium]